MNNISVIATTLTALASFEFLAAAGGIGWLLTMYCLWDKFDAKKDKKTHLVSDMINATFAVITLVAAVSIAVNLSIRLPDVIFNRLAGEIRRAVPPRPGAPPPSVTFADEILTLSRSGKLNDASLNEVLRRQLKGLSYYEGRLLFHADNSEFEITKNLEGHVKP